MLVANSPLDRHYNDLLDVYAEVSIGELGIRKPVLLWINDGLMAIFFLLIGLEVKREIRDGQLSNPRRIVLPGIARCLTGNAGVDLWPSIGAILKR